MPAPGASTETTRGGVDGEPETGEGRGGGRGARAPRIPPARPCSPSTEGSTWPRSATCAGRCGRSGGEYKIYKNTLVRFAARDLGLELDELLTGPTAIAFITEKPDGTPGDAVDVAKALRDFAKTNPSLVVKGGVLGTKPLTADEAQALAEVEPREVLLAKLAGALAAPDGAVRRPARSAAPQLRLRPQGPHRPAGRRAGGRRSGRRARSEDPESRGRSPPRPTPRPPTTAAEEAPAEEPTAEADTTTTDAAEEAPAAEPRRTTPPRRSERPCPPRKTSSTPSPT